MTYEDRAAILAKTIESKLKERGISRIEFAELLKVPPSSVTKWLNGKHNFTINTLFEIETALQFTLFDFNNTADPVDEWSWYIKKNRKSNKPH